MKTSIAVIHWLPRILGILAILFISMFALDAFEPGLPLLKQILNFIIHLIPSFILLIFLLLAWKKELTGGLIYLSIGLIFIPFIFSHNYQMNHSVGKSISLVLLINIPFVVIGILFILSHRLKRKIKM